MCFRFVKARKSMRLGVRLTISTRNMWLLTICTTTHTCRSPEAMLFPATGVCSLTFNSHLMIHATRKLNILWVLFIIASPKQFVQYDEREIHLQCVKYPSLWVHLEPATSMMNSRQRLQTKLTHRSSASRRWYQRIGTNSFTCAINTS